MFYNQTVPFQDTGGRTRCSCCCPHQKMGSLLAQICHRGTFSQVAVRDATSYPKFCFRAAALNSHPPPIVFFILLNSLNTRKRQAGSRNVTGHLKGSRHDMCQYKVARWSCYLYCQNKVIHNVE